MHRLNAEPCRGIGEPITLPELDRPRSVEILMKQHSSKLLLLALAYFGFISLGLPDPLAGVAWPSVREAFSLHQSNFGLVFIALGCGYCASGFFGGKLTQLLGLGNL